MLTILFDGVAYGMLLFVLACGLSVTLGLMNFVNLAHGAFAMAGGYITVVLVNGWACRSSLALPLAFLFTAVHRRRLRAHALCPRLRRSRTSNRCCSRSASCSCRSRRSTTSWARSSSSCGCRATCRARSTSLGVGIGRYRLLIIVVCGLLAVALQSPDADALRQPAARGRRRPRVARGPRHQRQRGLRPHLRGRLGPCRPRRRARRRDPRARSDVPAQVHDLLPDRRHGRRHLEHHRAVRRLAAARHRRRRRQVLRAEARRLHHLHHHDRGADLAAAGPVLARGRAK